MDILFYGNGSSGNHGCEAIVRGTAEMLDRHFNKLTVYSENPMEDAKYGLDQLATIEAATTEYRKNAAFVRAYLALKLKKDYTEMDGLAYAAQIYHAPKKANIAFSVGGDNYCYGGESHYAWLNSAYKKTGMKTVLFGCSIEPEVTEKPMVAEDLRRYALVVARESITYEAVRNTGAKSILAPDPAFFMESQVCDLDSRFATHCVVGVNLSPMVVSCEKMSGIAYENCKQLIRYILQHTDRYIALIPHVVWDRNDDRKVLRQLYEDFNQDERLILVEDHNAPELKYIISQCEFFVGARTHATIAAYSMGVPTLVLGYSVKARGIARDLFGSEDGYVLPVQDLQSGADLTNAFTELYGNRDSIACQLKQMLPEYLAGAQRAIEELERLSSL